MCGHRETSERWNRPEMSKSRVGNSTWHKISNRSFGRIFVVFVLLIVLILPAIASSPGVVTPVHAQGPEVVVTDTPTTTPEETPVLTDTPTATPEETPVLTDTPTATPEETPVPTDTPTATPEVTPVLTDTPTAAGTSNFTVQVTDSLSATATKALSITINKSKNKPPVIDAVTLSPDSDPGLSGVQINPTAGDTTTVSVSIQASDTK